MKKALVISGGGSKGAFAGGIAEYLLKEKNNTYDIFLGTFLNLNRYIDEKFKNNIYKKEIKMIKKITLTLATLISINSSGLLADSWTTYDNNGNWTTTYEYGNGSFHSYDNNGNWSNTYEYGDGNLSTFDNNGNWSNTYRY